MIKPKAVIMDLGDTIIRNIDFNFEKGLKYIYGKYLVNNYSYEDLLAFNTRIKQETIDKRDITNLEISFLEYLNCLEVNYNLKIDDDKYDIENQFINHAADDEIIDGVVFLLEFLKDNDIPIFILSNSMFSVNSLKIQIDKYIHQNFFTEVYSSSDLIFRKPHCLIFEIVINKIMNLCKINKKDIWYIGNDYRCDIIGANSAGLLPIWFNEFKKENTEKINCISINNYKELLDILKGLK